MLLLQPNYTSCNKNNNNNNNNNVCLFQGLYRNLTVVFMIFRDKATLFSKLFHTCLYKQNALKISINDKHKFNAKHETYISCTANGVGSLTYSVQKSFIVTVFQNDDNSSI